MTGLWFLHSAIEDPLWSSIVYQVSLNYLQYFKRYAPDKLFIAKIKKGRNSINTGDRVMVLAFYNFPHGPLSVYQVSLNYLQYFWSSAPDKSVTDGLSILLEICSRQKCDGQTNGWMDRQNGDYMLSLRGEIMFENILYLTKKKQQFRIKMYVDCQDLSFCIHTSPKLRFEFL